MLYIKQYLVQMKQISKWYPKNAHILNFNGMHEYISNFIWRMGGGGGGGEWWCVHVYVWWCTQLTISECVCSCMQVHTCFCRCVHRYLYVCACVCMLMCISMHVYACTCVHVHVCVVWVCVWYVCVYTCVHGWNETLSWYLTMEYEVVKKLQTFSHGRRRLGLIGNAMSSNAIF